MLSGRRQVEQPAGRKSEILRIEPYVLDSLSLEIAEGLLDLFEGGLRAWCNLDRSLGFPQGIDGDYGTVGIPDIAICVQSERRANRCRGLARNLL